MHEHQRELACINRHLAGDEGVVPVQGLALGTGACRIVGSRVPEHLAAHREAALLPDRDGRRLSTAGARLPVRPVGIHDSVGTDHHGSVRQLDQQIDACQPVLDRGDLAAASCYRIHGRHGDEPGLVRPDPALRYPIREQARKVRHHEHAVRDHVLPSLGPGGIDVDVGRLVVA